MNAHDIKTALPGYFTTAEAAAALGYADGTTIKLYCQRGQILAYKTGKTWLIPTEQIQQLADREYERNTRRGQRRT